MNENLDSLKFNCKGSWPKEGYLVSFNGGIWNKSSLPNPDLEQDDDVHGRILDSDENNVMYTDNLNVQISIWWYMCSFKIY